MRTRKAGKVTDNLWYLGREEAGVYFLQGKSDSVLINGSMSYILPDILMQMKAFGIDEGHIGKIMILHSHFDHVGIAPYFKRKYPDTQLYASAPAWKIFAMPKAIEIINSYSRLSAKWWGDESGIDKYDLDWRDDITGATLSEGDKIDLGGITLQIIETPGHSNCSITAYDPERKILFASDAVGIPYKDLCFPSMNTNMAQYLTSLEKLMPLPVSFLCSDHYGYISGDEATGFVKLTLAEGIKWKIAIEDVYRKQDGDIDAAAKAIADDFFKQMPDYFIRRDTLEGVFKQMLKFVSKNI